MSDSTQPNLHLSPDGPDLLGGGTGPGPAGARGGKSVALTSAGVQAREEGPSLDAANQSLADALKLIFSILNIALVVISVFYLLSGFQQIKEGESGVRLVFGKVDAQDLEPGFRFSFPYPIGQLQKVSTGNQSVELSKEFWPYVADSDLNKTVDQLPRNPQLNPERDGSLITADLNLAHTQWKVEYVRRNSAKYAQNVLPGENELNIVRAAVSRGVVHAMAAIDLDSFLAQPDADTGSVASQARQVAQRTLDSIESGITIERMTLREKIAPLAVRSKFQDVLSAEQNSAKMRILAEQYAQNKLNTTAGTAAVLLKAEIDAYEKAIETNDSKGAEERLARIDLILEGKEIEVNGTKVTPVVSGEVARLLADADQYRGTVVNQRQRELARVIAKNEQFKSNPLVTVHNEWADGLSTFLARENVLKLYLPQHTNTLSISVIPDPDVLRDLARQKNVAEGAKGEEQRKEEINKQRFNTPTGLQVTPKS